MKQIMEHYGPAVIVMLVCVVLGAICYGMYSTGFLNDQFESLLSNFFTQMNGFVPSVTP